MSQKKGINKLVFTLVAGILIAGCAESGFAQTEKPDEDGLVYRETKTTYVYKQVGDLKIKADVLQIEDDVARPVVVWIHGGALMTGGRDSVSLKAQMDLFAAGYDIITIDYRLAPETKLPEIIADLEDFFKWLHKEGPTELGIDTSRVAVVGGSAGGYLALTAGFRVNPRPTVIVSQFGYGDLIGPWQVEPSTFPRHNQPTDKMSEEDFLAVEKQPAVSNSGQRAKRVWVFYNVCRQRGLWPLMAAGWDPNTEPEKFYPYMPVKNVTPDFPPTLMTHGTEDTDVPHLQSELMEKEFIKHNVPYEFFSVEGAEHGLARAPWDKMRRSQELLVEWINKYMKVKKE
jgi:acetyl esterase/lipase